MVQREPIYREVAHLTIDTGRPNVHAMVQSIIDKLNHLEKKTPRRKKPKRVAVATGNEKNEPNTTTHDPFGS
jgi:3-dehydroquinate synthase